MFPVMHKVHNFRTLVVTALFACSPAGYGDTTVHRNEQNSLLTYSAAGNGFSIELVQVIPDFIRAVYGSHNIPKKEIELSANYCVYGSVIKNTSDKLLTYKVADWRYIHNGKSYPVKTKSQWLSQWRKAGVVFSWTLLPDTGEFYEGDWQMGFTTINAPRDSSFDLIYNWQLDGIKHSATLENMHCPPVEIAEDQ